MLKLFGMITTAASASYTAPALESFFKHTKLEAGDSFLLIDNDASYDVENLKPFPNVRCVKNPQPLSYSANGNVLIREALKIGADLYFLNNDLIFTPHWLDPLGSWPESITSPLSNREVQYACSVMVPATSHIANIFACSIAMSMEQFQGNEAALNAIAEANSRNQADFFRVYVAAFFCIRIPLKVMQAIGLFDEKFGKAGGEDFDYCLRAYLAGFDARYAVRSFVLHFGGKSSWSGAETSDAQQAREAHFRSFFLEKWGKPLHDMILREDKNIVGSDPELLAKDQSGNLVDVIRQLTSDRTIQLKLA